LAKLGGRAEKSKRYNAISPILTNNSGRNTHPPRPESIEH
jgi:hypothetical protein